MKEGVLRWYGLVGGLVHHYHFNVYLPTTNVQCVMTKQFESVRLPPSSGVVNSTLSARAQRKTIDSYHTGAQRFNPSAWHEMSNQPNTAVFPFTFHLGWNHLPVEYLRWGFWHPENSLETALDVGARKIILASDTIPQRRGGERTAIFLH